MITDTTDEVPLVPNTSGLLAQIEAYQEPIASNMMIIWTQIIRMLCSIQCSIAYTGKWNYLFITFTMIKFLLLKGIRQEAVPAIDAVEADNEAGATKFRLGRQYGTVYPQVKSIQQVRASHHPRTHSPTTSISHGGSILIGGCLRMHP